MENKKLTESHMENFYSSNMTYLDLMSDLKIHETPTATMDQLYSDIKKICFPTVEPHIYNVRFQSGHNSDRWSTVLIQNSRTGHTVQQVAIEKMAKRLDDKRPYEI